MSDKIGFWLCIVFAVVILASLILNGFNWLHLAALLCFVAAAWLFKGEME